MKEERSGNVGEVELLVSRDKSEGPSTKTRKVPLAVMPVTRFGKYNLIGKLGHGGMAEVFLAYAAGPAGFRKLVVIKRLHRQLEEEPGFLEMFLDEARLAARLNHPNIVQCFEVGDAEGSHFIAMEYLEGQALDRIRRHCLRNGVRIEPPVAARMIIDALDGLHYAHDLEDFDGTPLEIVHRDVSPQNVFVTYDGVAKLLDFGIAKATTHVVETRTGVVKGKYAYMAPEQARGEEVDARADLWSMGVVLWEALANKRLFQGPNELATLNQSLMGKAPHLKEVVPDIPDALADVVSRALNRDVDQRYQLAQEMKLELQMAFGGEHQLAPRAEVARFVKGLFGEIIEQQRRVLEACLSDSQDDNSNSSGRYRMAEPTPPDLRMTPNAGVASPVGPLPSGAPAQLATPVPNDMFTPASVPSGQAYTGATPLSIETYAAEYATPEYATPVSQSGMQPVVVPPPQGSGWQGKIGILLGAVLVAVLSTIVVLYLFGPRPPEGQGSPQRIPGSEDLISSAGQPQAPAPNVAKQGQQATPATPATPPAETTPASAMTPAAALVPDAAAAETNRAETPPTAVEAPTPTEPAAVEPAGPTPVNRPRPAKRPRNRPRKVVQNPPFSRPVVPTPPPTVEQPAEEQPAEGFGYLTFDTIPWSQVSAGGRSLGDTPVIRARLPAGTHTLRLRNPEANISTSYRVTIRAGETTTQRLGLQ